jgi:hypothetical protein
MYTCSPLPPKQPSPSALKIFYVGEAVDGELVVEREFGQCEPEVVKVASLAAGVGVRSLVARISSTLTWSRRVCGAGR